MNKTLLRPEMKLKLGDYIMEASRFNIKERYVVWEVVELDPDDDWMKIKCVDWGSQSYVKTYGYTCSAQISAHTIHKNCDILSYYLTDYIPVRKLLYEPVPKDNLPITKY